MLLFKRRVLTQSSTLAFWQIVSSRAKTNEKKNYLILLKNTKNPGSPISSILFFNIGFTASTSNRHLIDTMLGYDTFGFKVF